MLEVSTSAVSFGEVAVNDIPSYKQIKLTNTQDTPLSVHIASTSPSVRFQSSNENAFINVNDMDDRLSYNELFDLANLIDTIELGPREERAFVAYFRADKKAFGHLLPQSQPVTHTGTINLTATGGGCTGSGAFPRSASAAQGVGHSSSDTSVVPTRRTSPETAVSQTVSSVTLRSESVQVPMYASVYLSQLQVSPAELQLTMAPNKTQCLNFSVTNVCSRPLTFVIRSQTMTVKGLDVALYEAERFEEPKLGHRLLLDSHASINLSVMLRSTVSSFSLQQYQFVLQCDNLQNPDNTALVNVSVNIMSESQGDLVTLSDTTLSFGNVYRGTRAAVELGFLNTDGRGDVIISLSSSYKRKANGEVVLSKDGNVADEFNVPAQKGMQYVKLLYKPAPISEPLENEKVKFDLDFTATSLSSGRKQRIAVWCSANLFTSTIIASTKNINFGDCQVGESKRHTFTVENQSPLPGRVRIQIRSKIISIEGASPKPNVAGGREICEDFTIGSSSKLTVTLKISPQRVNSTYRKQLSIVNLENPNEDKQIINIEANNMAPPEAKKHNELYTWDCRLPGGVTQSEILHTIANVPALVPYTIKAKMAEPIVLNIKSTCPEIDVLLCTDPLRTQRLEAVASEWMSYCVYGKDSEVSDLLNTSLEQIEELRKELIDLLSEGCVVVTKLSLEPKGIITVFAVIIRSLVTPDAQTKEDGLLISVDGVETPRFVRLSYYLCGSLFDLLGQKTRNFGEVNIGVKKTTKLPIKNKCKSVLFVKVEKSRSVTAGHIRIEHSDKQLIFVVVRPFATKEIELSFIPGIKGSFDEKVKLTNVLDPANSYVLTLKATVIKADTFDVSPDSWNFGSVLLPPLDDPQQQTRIGARFMVTNTSKARRQIRVKLDVSSSVASAGGASSSSGPLALLHEMGSQLFGFSGVDVRIQLDMELSSGISGSARKTEEVIEKLEQKLKIHERKKKFDKMEAVKKRIEELKKTLQGEEVDLSALTSNAADHDYSESEDEAAPQQSKDSQSTQLMMQLLRDGAPLLTMAAGESVAITFGLLFSRLPDQPAPPVQTTTLNLLLYEAKDQEVNRIFPIDITLVRPEEEEPDVHTVSSSMGALSSGGAGSGSVVPSSVICLESGNPGLPLSSFMGNPLIVLRNTIVNDHTELTFLVKATSNTTVVVLEPRRCGGVVSETLDAKFKFFPRNGTVGADEALRIVAECTPRSVGPQKYFVPIKNLQNAADVQYYVIELNPTEEEERVITDPKQLTFHDLVTPCNPQVLETQLVLIRSRFQFPHSLLIRSNKPSQVLLFEDPQCSTPLRNPIQRTFMRETVRVYVTFSPSPKSNYHTARQIRAGIVVEAIVANGGGGGEYITVGQSVVEVTVRVGSGLLEVPSARLEFGSVGSRECVVKSVVPITNPSDTFLVRTRIVPESNNVVVPTADVVTLRPRETKEFPVELTLRKPGLYHEHVTFHNLTCRQRPITVELSLFQRDDAVAAVTQPSPGGDYVLPVAAVSRGEDGVFHLHSCASTTVAIRNACVKDIILTSQCPLPLFLSSPEDRHGRTGGGRADDVSLLRGGSPASLDAGGGSGGGGAGGGGGGGRVRLEAHHTQKTTWTLLGVPEMDDDQVQRLLRYDMVPIRGVAQVVVAQVEDAGRVDYNFFRAKPQLPSIGQCVLLLPFVVPVAISEGRAEPTLINLGVVGQGEDDDGDDDKGKGKDKDNSGGGGAANALGDTASPPNGRAAHQRVDKSSSVVRVMLTNLSQHLPLQLKVECQPTLRFSRTHFTLRPGEVTEVQARLLLNDIRAQGSFRYDAFFVNGRNPENDLTVSITGQYYWKVFRLSTKTVDDIHETLALPPLRVEGSGAVPMVLSEEKITVSATEPNVELQLAVQGNPKLEGLVQLQVVHYDATSSVETLTFQDERGDGASGSGGGAVDGPNNRSANTDTGEVGAAADGTATATAAAAATTTTAAAVAAGAAMTTAAAAAGATASSTSGGGGGSGSLGVTAAGGPAGGGAGAVASASGAGSQGTALSGTGSTAAAGSAQANRRKGPQQQQQQRSQKLRVRCVLLHGDLGRLARAFSGFCKQRKGWSAAEMLTFDGVAELERRRTASVFSNCWLGTITISNRLTRNEDITVFGQLDPFTTFTAPSKVPLQPSRMAAAAPVSPPTPLRHNDDDDPPPHSLVYTGELRITNDCESYLAELAATALISGQFTMPITVQIASYEETSVNDDDGDENSNSGKANDGGEGEEDEGAKGAGAAAAEPGRNTAVREGRSQDGAADHPGGGARRMLRTSFTNAEGGALSQEPPSPPSRTLAEGGPVSHRFRLGPKATIVLHLLIFSNNPQDMRGMQQSSLERLAAVVVWDEDVMSSINVVRFSVTPLEGDVEEAPLYVGATTAATTTVAAGGGGGAGAAATAAVDGKEISASASPSFAAASVRGADERRGGGSPEQSGVGAGPSANSPGGALPPPNGAGGSGPLSTSDSLELSALLHHAGGNNGAAVSAAGAGERRSSPGNAAPAAAAAAAPAEGGPPPGPLLPTKHALSLKGCNAVSDCPGAYSASYTVPRGEAPPCGIVIRNNLPDRAVEYTASVTSQSPLSWVLLLSNSGVLEAGETQPLRLSFVTSEVGSFVGYVAIRNGVNPYEVVYLRLSAEVFVPSSGEGLFEVVTISGHRVASNEVHNVSLGHLYGSRASRAYIALELVNRSNVPLEFPVSVVKPFRITTKSVRDSASLVGLYEPPPPLPPHHHQHRQHHHHDHRRGPTATSPHVPRLSRSGLDGASLHRAPSFSSQGTLEGPVGGDPSAVSSSLVLSLPPPPISAPLSFPDSQPVFEGKLIACHIHGVPTQTSQKYIVVDPKSRVRLAFVLSCLALRVPDGCGVFGEADVLFGCKQARDANFIFRVRFEAHKPTFQVCQEVEVDPEEDYTRVAVRNLLPTAQTFVFRSQSPVLYVVPGTGTAAGDAAAFAAAATNASKAVRPSCFASLEIRGGGGGGAANATGYFAVRVDVMWAAALSNFDKDDAVLRPVLCEHAFVLNAHNPRERVRLQFFQRPKGSSGGDAVRRQQPSEGQSAAASLALVPANAPSPLLGGGAGTTMMTMVASASTVAAKPAKVDGQHIEEHHIMRFAQDFTSTLSFYEEPLTRAFAYYGARRDDGAAGAAGTSSDEDSSEDSSEDSHPTKKEASLTGTPGEEDPRGARCRKSRRNGNGNGGGSSCSSSSGGSSSSGSGSRGSGCSNSNGRDGSGGGATTATAGLRVPQQPPLSFTGARVLDDPIGGNASFGESAPTTASSSPHHASFAVVAGFNVKKTHGAASTTPRRRKPSHTTAAAAVGVGAGSRERRRYGLPAAGWRRLRALLLDLTWIVDELVFYSILLRNSRLIQGYCVFVVAAVCNHPVVKAWRQYKTDLPAAFDVFAGYAEMLTYLPCPMPS